MFFNSFNKHTRKLFMDDIDKHNVLAWIIYQTNYDKYGYKELSQYQCYISSSIISKSTKINITKIKRLLKELEIEGYFDYYFKSNGGNNRPSIINVNYKLWCELENEPVHNPVKNPVIKDGICTENASKIVYLKKSKELDYDLESEHLSKNTSKNIYYEIKEKFNSTCLKLDKVKMIGNEREITIQKLLDATDNNLNIIFEVFEMASACKFLNGESDSGWRANFDWIISLDNFIKIYEGKYNNKEDVYSNKIKKYDEYGYEII